MDREELLDMVVLGLPRQLPVALVPQRQHPEALVRLDSGHRLQRHLELLLLQRHLVLLLLLDLLLNLLLEQLLLNLPLADLVLQRNLLLLAGLVLQHNLLLVLSLDRRHQLQPLEPHRRLAVDYSVVRRLLEVACLEVLQVRSQSLLCVN